MKANYVDASHAFAAGMITGVLLRENNAEDPMIRVVDWLNDADGIHVGPVVMTVPTGDARYLIQLVPLDGREDE